MPDAPTGRAPKPALPPRHFEFFTGALRAAPDTDPGERIITATASSTVVDHYATRWPESAQEDMERSAVGMTVFRDHEHGANDSLGTVIDAKRTVAGDVMDLIFTIRLLPDGVDEDVDRLWRRIQAGVRLGLSVGAQVLEARKARGIYNGVERDIIEFVHVLLHEASIVGLPGNPRGWVHYALRSLAAEEGFDMPAIRDLIDADIASVLDGNAVERAATDEEKAAREARSTRYKIGVKEGGNVTKPSEWSSVPDEEWGDPVNYRYPMPDKEYADNAASRWGDESNREGYSSEEQAIISRRIKTRQAHFGESKDGKDDDGERSVPAKAFAGLELRGIIAVELAEREFFEDLYQLNWTLMSIIRNYMSQEDGNPAEIGANVKAAVAEYAVMVDALVAKALAAGVAGPQDNDRAPTSDDDDDDVVLYSLGDADTYAVTTFVTALRAHQMSAPARDRMQAIHDHAAAALGMDCAPDDDGDDDDTGAGDGSDDGDRSLPDLSASIAAFEARHAEIERQLAAAASLIADHKEILSGLTERRRAVEAEVQDLEAKRTALLTQGTGRPTQGKGESLAEPLTERDLWELPIEEIGRRAAAIADPDR